MQHKLKQITPPRLWKAASSLRYSIGRASQWPCATFHPLRLESKRKLARFNNIHQGQRCFIIGNGPSLKNTNLSLLKNEFTFGMNRIYLLFPELGFTTTYYLSVNSLVIEQCHTEIESLKIPKFLSWRSHRYVQEDEHTIYLHTTYTGATFARDARRRLWEGATVTYVALQLAYYMGFSRVILIGVDHSFTSQGKPNTTITSPGDDPDHFHAQYFGKGFRWQLPDLETSERAYRMALHAYQKANREVWDATVGGKLTVFPKVDYASLF